MSRRRRRMLFSSLLVPGLVLLGVAGSAGSTAAAPPVLFSDGFESGTAAWTSNTGIVVQSATVAEGSEAARGTMSGSGAFVSKTLDAPTSETTASLDVYVASIAGTGSVNFLKLRTAGSAAIAEIYVQPNGRLGLRNDVLAASTTSSTVVTTGVWHTVALHVVISGTTSTYDVTWDGTPVAALSGTTNLGTSPIGRVQVGENLTGRTGDLSYDAVSVTGAGSAPTPAPTPTPTPTPMPTPTPTPTTSPTPPATGDPVLAAAGDIACDPLSSSFNGGNGTTNNCKEKAVSDAILADPSVSAVAALGDVQYYCGGPGAFAASYDPTWGRFKALTHPAVGNHEYIASTTSTQATGCDPTGTASGYFSYFGAAAGAKGQGYYSYDLGAWHIIVLNTTCSQAGGCGTKSPQETWLRADLAAHPALCTLAYWHIPLWSSGGRANNNSKVFTQDLSNAGADIVLTGHDHTYERFAPQDANGVATPNGLRAWVVGTGGADHTSFTTIAPNSVVRNASTFGFLRLTLHPTSYDWRFVPVGGTFTDSGTGTCH